MMLGTTNIKYNLLLTIYVVCACVLENLISLKSTFRFNWLKLISSHNNSLLYYVSCNYLISPWSRVLLRSTPVCSQSRNSPQIMEPESSLPHSQVPATCPYPEPARSRHDPTTHFLKIHFSIIRPSMPGSSKLSLSLRFRHQIPPYNSLLPHTRHKPRPRHSSLLYHP